MKWLLYIWIYAGWNMLWATVCKESIAKCKQYVHMATPHSLSSHAFTLSNYSLAGAASCRSPFNNDHCCCCSIALLQWCYLIHTESSQWHYYLKGEHKNNADKNNNSKNTVYTRAEVWHVLHSFSAIERAQKKQEIVFGHIMRNKSTKRYRKQKT